MKIQRREKILGIAALGLLGLVALYFLLIAGDSRSDEQLATDRTKLTTEIDGKQKMLQAAARDAKRMADWQKRSLPADPVIARSLYQDWVRTLANKVNLHAATIVVNDAGARRDQFSKISCTLRARGSLGDLIDFMHEFYSVGYLHQIRKLDVKPVQSEHDLDINMTIEALSLPTAETKGQLPKETGHGLLLAKRSEYHEPIVARNFFTAYVKPKPPAPPAPPQVAAPAPRRRDPPTIDPADYAFVTGITEVDGAFQVWLQDRIVGKLWKLGTGEVFAIGKVQGKVETIDPDGGTVIEFDGHRRRLRDGENLHGGIEIKADGPKQ